LRSPERVNEQDRRNNDAPSGIGKGGTQKIQEGKSRNTKNREVI
jgi:hypothetical protein